MSPNELVTPKVDHPKPRRRGATIGAHLVALVSIQLVLVLGLIGFAAIQDFQTARADAEKGSQANAELAADFVADEIDDIRSEIAEIPQYGGLLTSPSVCAIADQEQSFPGMVETSFLLLRTDGSSFCPPKKGDAAYPNVANADWFKRAMATGEPVEEGPVHIAATDTDAMVFAVAVPDHDVVVATIADLGSFSKAISEKFKSTHASPSYVVTAKNRGQLLSSGDNKRGVDLAGTPFARDINGGTMFADLSGVDRIYGHAAVRDLGWHVYAGIPDGDAFSAAWRSLRERVLFAGVMVLLVVLAAMFLQRRFVRPIRSLARVTRKAAEGDLSAKVSPSGPSELSELGESFNAMLEIRKDAEAALNKAYKAERKAANDLREVDTMRNAFLMAISHELRTPLTSVVGYSSFLMDSIDNLPEEELHTSIKAISTQSRRLERLLTDLLDVERLSRGIVEPHLVDTDVNQLIMRVIEQTTATGRIRADLKGAVHADIDPALVERMVENLVFNAIKHTPNDTKIWVRARRVNGHLRVVVEDSGNGVPDEIKTAIFEAFKQGVVPEHSPGTGVGLNLVAQFAKLHGGRAWVEDRRGGGASFRIELPAKSNAKRAPAKRGAKRAA